MFTQKASATRAIGSCVREVTTHVDKVEGNTSGARVEILSSSAGFHFNLCDVRGEWEEVVVRRKKKSAATDV